MYLSFLNFLFSANLIFSLFNRKIRIKALKNYCILKDASSIYIRLISAPEKNSRGSKTQEIINSRQNSNSNKKNLVFRQFFLAKIELISWKSAEFTSNSKIQGKNLISFLDFRPYLSLDSFYSLNSYILPTGRYISKKVRQKTTTSKRFFPFETCYVSA